MVDIIIPVGKETNLDRLRIILGSCSSQIYQNIKIYIIDYGMQLQSTIKEDFPYLDVEVITTQKRNVISALNIGIEKSSQKYICWSLDGSIFYPDKLKIQTTTLSDDILWGFSGFTFLRGNKFDYYVGMDHFGKFFNPSTKSVSMGLINNFPNANFVNKSTVICNRTLFDSVGLFDESLNIFYDYDMWIRFAYISEPSLVTYPLVLSVEGKAKKFNREKELEKIKAKKNHYMVGDFNVD